MPMIPQPEKPYQLIHRSRNGDPRELMPLYAEEGEALARGSVVLQQLRDEQRDGLIHASGTLQVVNRLTSKVVAEDTI